MNLRIFGKIFILFTLAVGAVRAGDNTGMAFLKLPVDARSAAMGEVSTALSGDAAVAFRNPAALSVNSTRSFMLMHNAYLADIAQEFAAFQFANGKHSAALALNIMDIPGIEIRGSRPTSEAEGKTDAINFAFGASYAFRYNDVWAVGSTVKYLFEKYYLASASGWAIDLGILRRNAFFKKLDWGLAVQNLGRMNPLKNERTPLPVILRSGLQYHLNLDMKGLQSMIAVADVEHIFNEGTLGKFGLEVPLLHVIALRAGTILSSEKVRFSAGFGIRYKNYLINYAFSPYPYNLGNSHRFSLSWRF